MGSALTIEAVGRRQIALWLLLAWQEHQQQNETDPSFFHLYAPTKS